MQTRQSTEHKLSSHRNEVVLIIITVLLLGLAPALDARTAVSLFSFVQHHVMRSSRNSVGQCGVRHGQSRMRGVSQRRHLPSRGAVAVGPQTVGLVANGRQLGHGQSELRGRAHDSHVVPHEGLQVREDVGGLPRRSFVGGSRAASAAVAVQPALRRGPVLLHDQSMFDGMTSPMHRLHHLLASLRRGVVVAGAVPRDHARHHLAHRGAVDQSLQQARAGESVSPVQSRPRRLSRGVQIAIPPGAVAPAALPHDAPVQIGRHAAARVVRGGNDGNPLLGEIHGRVPRRQVGLNRGESILQPLGVAVGDVEVGVVPPPVVRALLALHEDGARDDVPRGEFAVGMVILREGASVEVAEYGALAAQRLGEKESRLVGEEERGGMELNVFQVGYDAVVVVVVVVRMDERSGLPIVCIE
mmetsp:Transcript_18080/g.37790  ORF Transcript_18080/g.37790 Transcript_18080/m.37790 type:complete len:414 (-) Transcript_18080:73-1314(-)